jgi:hypothetical protein
VEYSPEIFDVDKPDFVLPEFVNRITPVSGAVDSGVINPDRWRSFAVYHDGEDEPDRPSGDGQGDGWHHLETFRSIWQSTKMSESVESGEWGLPVRIRAERGTDDVTPIWLSLDPQNVTLDTDGDGNLPAGLFPLIIKARLFKWNSLLTGAVFSLPSDPDGISVDSNGVITVNEYTVLNDENAISIRAEYHGATYTATLSITKNINNSAPRYLGTVKELSTAEATVTIEKGPVTGQVRARQGDYVLTVTATGGRLAGSVFQWSGTAWEYRAPENYSELYIRCFKDGLDVPELSQDMGWFGAVFAKLLVAQRAFIEELSAQVIELREGGEIKNKLFTEGLNGFRIKANGQAEFNEAIFRGDVYARNGIFTGDIISGQLFSSNTETGEELPPITFPSSATAKTVWDYYGGYTQTRNVASGSFSGQGGLIGFHLDKDTIPVYDGISFGNNAIRYILNIQLFNQSAIQRTWADVNGQRNTLGGALIIDGGKKGAIFKLHNVPGSANGLEKGQIYYDSGGVLRIKL